MIFKKENTTNILINFISFIVLLALLSTGGLLYFRLPPRSGHAAEILSLGRHDWGEIHLWLGLCFLLLMVLHLWCHRGWILRTFFSGRTRLNQLLVFLIFLLLFAVAAFPYFLPIERRSGFAFSQGKVSSGESLKHGAVDYEETGEQSFSQDHEEKHQRRQHKRHGRFGKQGSEPRLGELR